VLKANGAPERVSNYIGEIPQVVANVGSEPESTTPTTEKPVTTPPRRLQAFS